MPRRPAAAAAAAAVAAAVAPPCDMTLPDRHGLLNGSAELCEAYCNYSCGFYDTSAGDTGQPQAVRMYRLTPPNVSGVGNKNTGDPLGDIGYTISQMGVDHCDRVDTSKILCRPGDLYAEFIVETTGQYGPYQECNPNYGWDTTNWTCDQQCAVPPNCGNQRRLNMSRGAKGTTCWCEGTRRHLRDTGRIANSAARNPSGAPPGWPAQCGTAFTPIVTGCIHGEGGYRTVRGWDRASTLSVACEACFADANCTAWGLDPAGGNLSATLFRGERHADPALSCPSALRQRAAQTIFPPWRQLSFIGGWWYSTPDEGECAEGAALGDGGCTWRLTAAAKYRNASCVEARVNAVVERNLWSACFADCPPNNQTSQCYVDCYRHSLLGDPARNATPADVSAMVAAWHTAFDSADPSAGGCPVVTPAGA